MKPIDSVRLQHYHSLLGEIQGIYHEYAMHHGVSDSVCAVLYTISSQGGSMPTAELCRLSGLTRQTVHSALERLEKEGVIRRSALDGRAKLVELTEQGEALAEKTVLPLMHLEACIFEGWPKEEADGCLNLTEAFLRQLRERVGDA